MQCTKIFDGRSLPGDAKEQLRIAAVRRVIASESPESVAKGMGLNRRTIYPWLEAYHYGAEDALKAKFDYHAGTTWSPTGKTPVVEATGAPFSVNMLLTVNAQGGFRFMTVEGRVNANVEITGDRREFLSCSSMPQH